MALLLVERIQVQQAPDSSQYLNRSESTVLHLEPTGLTSLLSLLIAFWSNESIESINSPLTGIVPVVHVVKKTVSIMGTSQHSVR
jgi:hypothetical protein